MNATELIDLVAQRAGLGDAGALAAAGRATEYVRARAVVIKILTEWRLGPHEISRLLKRTPKAVRHLREAWPHVWAKDAIAVRLYEDCRQI